jgi:hypothetical protein
MTMDPVMVEFQKKKWRLSALAKERGIPFTTAYSRWRKLGRPAVIDESMLGPINAGQSRRMNKEGYTIDGINYENAAKAGLIMGVGPTWIQRRFRALGKREATKAELFAVEVDGRTGIKIGCKAKPKKLSDRFLPMDHPDFLPHIPYGDLMHLSCKENTGAGRGEVENPTSFRTGVLAQQPLGLPLMR